MLIDLYSLFVVKITGHLPTVTKKAVNQGIKVFRLFNPLETPNFAAIQIT